MELCDWIGISRLCFAFGTRLCQEWMWLTQWLDSRPPPMLPGLNSRSRLHVGWFRWFYCSLIGFSLVTAVFPSPQKPTFVWLDLGLSWFIVSSFSRTLVLGYINSNCYCCFCRACQMNVLKCRYTAPAVRSFFLVLLFCGFVIVLDIFVAFIVRDTKILFRFSLACYV